MAFTYISPLFVKLPVLPASTPDAKAIPFVALAVTVIVLPTSFVKLTILSSTKTPYAVALLPIAVALIKPEFRKLFMFPTSPTATIPYEVALPLMFSP